MSNLSFKAIGELLWTYFSASDIVRLETKDGYRIVGGYLDGVEVTRQELEEASQGQSTFYNLMVAKMKTAVPRKQNKMIGAGRPVSGPVERGGATMRPSETMLSMEPGSVVRFALKGGGSEYRVVPKTPEPRELQDVVLKPRKYGKDT